MALQLNNGATTNQRAYLAAPIDPTLLAITVAGWFYFDSAAVANNYVFQIKSAASLYGFICRLTNSNGSLDMLRRYGGGDQSAATGAGVVSSGVWHHIVYQHNGQGNIDGVAGRPLENIQIWVDGTLRAVTQPAATAGVADSMTGEVWDLFNRDDETRKASGRVRDVTVYTGPINSYCLNAADVATLAAGGNPMTLTPAGGGTIRSCARFIGGLTWDEVAQTDWTLANGPTAVNAPHIPLAADYSDGFPTISGLAGRWTCGDNNGAGTRTHVVRSTSTAGNCIAMLDVSGNSRPLFQATANNRPRAKVNSPDFRIAFNVSDGSNPRTLACNNAANIANQGITIGLVVARVVCTGTGEFLSIAGIKIKTDLNGLLAVETPAGTVNFSPAVRVTAKPMPMVMTIEAVGGNVSRTVTLYTPEGVSTAASGAYAAATGTIATIGANTGSVVNGVYVILKEAALWTAVLTASEAASVLASWTTTYNLPATYNGCLYFFGSSSAGGAGVHRSGNAAMAYQLARASVGRARVFQDGVSGCGIADSYANPLSGSGTYTVGESVSQTTSLATGIVAYQGAGGVYIRNRSGTFNTTDPILGTTSGTSRTPGGVSSTTSAGLWNATRVAYYTGVLSAYSGRAVAMLFASSNPINLAWPVTDVVEIDKLYVAALKAAVPGLKVYMLTNIPRAGVYGNNHQTYNAAIRAVSGVWDGVVDLETLAGFNFLDGSGVDDDGVFDRDNPTFYTEDTGLPDAIHANEAAHAAWATVANLKAAAGLGIGAGSTFRDREFRERILVR